VWRENSREIDGFVASPCWVLFIVRHLLRSTVDSGSQVGVDATGCSVVPMQLHCNHDCPLIYGIVTGARVGLCAIEGPRAKGLKATGKPNVYFV
jgi:hypothetical protein